jgi:hypothetical protein
MTTDVLSTVECNYYTLKYKNSKLTFTNSVPVRKLYGFWEEAGFIKKAHHVLELKILWQVWMHFYNLLCWSCHLLTQSIYHLVFASIKGTSSGSTGTVNQLNQHEKMNVQTKTERETRAESDSPPRGEVLPSHSTTHHRFQSKQQVMICK